MPVESDNLSVEYVLDKAWPLPLWLSIVVGLTLLALVAYLYALERGPAAPRLRLLLTAIRFSLLAIVLWMLAGWNWQRFKSERPELVLAIDRSASMQTNDAALDAAQPMTRIEAARQLFQNLDERQRRSLSQRYQLKWFSVSENLESQSIDLLTDPNPLEKLAADGSHSRLGDALGRLVDRQVGSGTAAVVFISDGITTAGTTLNEAAKKARRSGLPFHTLVLGKQTAQPDLRLVDLLVDREVYLGDQVTAEGSLVASDIVPTKATVSLRDMSNNNLLDSAVIELQPNGNPHQIRLSFVPERTGEIPLQLSVTPIQGEVDQANNTLLAPVMVQDKAIRVLMIFPTANYEFRFLKSWLDRSRQVGARDAASFELQSVLQDADADYVEQDTSAVRLVPSGPALADYDVFVIGQVDPSMISRSAQQAIYDAVTTGGSGCIFVLGSAGRVGDLNNWPLGKLLPVERSLAPRPAESSGGPFEWRPTTLGATALPMQLAGSPRKSQELWQLLPAASQIADVEDLKPGAQLLAVAVDQQSGNESPLLISQFAGAGRTALQTSDETYRWSSFAGSDLVYQRYWGQMLRWLSRGKLSRRSEISEVSVDPKQARLGQPVRLQVSLGGASARGQLPDSVAVQLEGADGSRQSFSLPRSDMEFPNYQLTRSDLPVGNYRLVLLQPIEDIPPAAEFAVTAPPGEQANLRANADEMQFLAKHSRGRFYTAATASQLLDQLPAGQPARIGGLPPLPLWNSPWIALLFVVLLTSEWLLRRHARML